MAQPRKVYFLSNGLKIAADLYLPPSSTSIPDRKGAAIVVGHQGTGVKEQASGLYAKILSSNGFIVLAFDAAYQGESEGLPRGLEDPAQRVEDFKCAVSYLATPGDGSVDPDRIGVVGICASGGYGICAASTDIRIKAVAGISPLCFGMMTRQRMNDPATGQLDPQRLHQALSQAAQDRIMEMKGNQPTTYNILDDWSQPRENIKAYYSSPRWSHPRCTNQMVARSVELLVSFDAFQHIEWVSPRPILVVIGGEAMTRQFCESVFCLAKEPKEMLVVEGKSHTELYEDASVSGTEVSEFMAKALCAE